MLVQINFLPLGLFCLVTEKKKIFFFPPAFGYTRKQVPSWRITYFGFFFWSNIGLFYYSSFTNCLVTKKRNWNLVPKLQHFCLFYSIYNHKPCLISILFDKIEWYLRLLFPNYALFYVFGFCYWLCFLVITDWRTKIGRDGYIWL